MADRPAIVVIRNTYAAHWHARLDGRTAPLMPVDYLVQGVAVTPGHHTIVLSYDDPSIGYSLAGSAIVIGALLGTALLLRRRIRPS